MSIVVGGYTYHAMMWRLCQGALAIWLETGVVAAFAITVSTLMGPVPVTVASLAFVFVGHLGGGIAQTEGAGSASSFYPTLETFNIINPVAHGSGVSAAYLALMLVVGTAWVGAVLGLGALFFERKDL